MQQEISEFLQFKWDNDKNNFLVTPEDHLILQNLTQKQEKTVIELYTKFIYRNFLKRFNRLFMIKKDVVPNCNKCTSVY